MLTGWIGRFWRTNVEHAIPGRPLCFKLGRECSLSKQTGESVLLRKRPDSD